MSLISQFTVQIQHSYCTVHSQFTVQIQQHIQFVSREIKFQNYS